MQTIIRTLSITTLAGFAAACQPAGPAGGSRGSTPPASIAADAGTQAAFTAIRPDETIRLIGTEPFWGGTIAGGQMTYTTPENQAGEVIAVRRFAGNNGLGFSGSRPGGTVDIAITPGKCSDGMSDRTFPFTATLKLEAGQSGQEQRQGCAWTDRQPFTAGPQEEAPGPDQVRADGGRS